MNITSIGISGMRAAESRFQAAATNIVRSGVVPSAEAGEGAIAAGDDLASSMVALELASYDFKAAAKVVQVGRDLLRSTLDILA